MRTSRFVIALVCSGFVSVPALAINKCEIDGKVSYTEAPCPAGKTTVLASVPAPNASAVAQAKAIAGKDARALQKIEAEKAKQDKADLAANKAAARNAAKQAKQQKKCAQLAQKKRWADEDAAKAGPKNQTTARSKASRAAEKMELECKDASSSSLM